MAEISADNIIGIKCQCCRGLQRIFEVIHRKTESLFCLPCSHRRDFDEPQQVFQEEPCIGASHVRNVGKRMPRNGSLPRCVLSPLNNLRG